MNNEPCQLIGDSTSPSQTAESEEVTINGNAPFALCLLLNTPQKTTISSFLPPAPLHSAHYVSTFPPTRRLRGRVIGPGSNSSRRRNAFAFACFTSLLRKFASCSSNNRRIIIKNTKKKKKVIRTFRIFSFLLHLLQPEPAGSHRSLIASLSVKRQTMTDVALAFVFPANSLFSQIARRKSVGSYRFQAMSCHIQSHTTPCALCHSTLLSKGPRSLG